MSASNEPISIAIIGAGIAGITLAIALSRHSPSLQLKIYASRPGFSEIGAGVGFGPNAIQAMQLISPDLAAAHNRIATPNASPEKEATYGLMSAMELVLKLFLDGVVALIPKKVKTVFGMKVVHVVEDEESGKMKVKFLDGTEIEADAVVG
ncbi:hypothetical protein BDZ45DRAFT_800786 [Acephala macrosclerotiorum]|nr:hypothetical protein BDZ45DRAFT_800786 [Acephala macrosclerotiorum]